MSEIEEINNGFNAVVTQMVSLGNATRLMGESIGDDLLRSKGNIVALIGSIVGSDEDVEELEAYLAYFTAKKMAESISPSNLSTARMMTDVEKSGGLGEIGELLKNIGGPDLGNGVSDLLEKFSGNPQINDDNIDKEIDDLLSKYIDDNDDDE